MRFFHLTQYQNTTNLSHCFHQQDTRHYRFFREVSYKEGFIPCNILDPYYNLFLEFDNLIHKQEGITVGQHALYLCDIVERLKIWIIVWSIYLKMTLADFLA